LLVGAAVLIPVAYLLFRAFGAADSTLDMLFRARSAAIIARSLLLVVIVTAGSVTIAVPVAFLATRTDLPWRRFWAVAIALPLVTPSYVAAMVAVAALGPRGMLQGLLDRVVGIDRLPAIYGLPGAALVLVLLCYPYVYIMVRASLRRMDPALEEAARGLGYGQMEALRRVVLPLLRPAIAAGALLVALYTLSDFGAVSLLGYETFTWAIYLQYETTFDRTAASALSLVLVVAAVSILMLESFTQARGRYYRSTAGTVRPHGVARLGRWRWVAFGLVGALFAIAVVAPLSVLAYWALRGGVQPGLSFPVAAAWNSVRVAALAAAVTSVTAFPVAVLAVRFGGRLTTLLDRASHIGFALPGIVIALALVFFGVNFVTPVYQTLALLVFAYVVLFLPAASGAIKASLMQLNPHVEEAARALGRSEWRVAAQVTIPMVMPGVLAGAAMVFLLTMKELPATLILAPLGFKTLATSVWSAASEAFFARAALPSVMLVAVAGVPAAYLLLRDAPRESNRSSQR
jgi:iron(III) transport system permease protein